MAKLIEVNTADCTGCRYCEMICSFHHEHACSTTRSRIKIVVDQEYGNHLVSVCAQCSDAPCVEICPTAALRRDERTGAVLVEAELCHACKTCVAECPLDAMFFDKARNVVFVCDLCNGDPECVKVCTRRALKTIDVDYTSPARRTSIEKRSGLLLAMPGVNPHN